jgi:hypothetical protein
MKAIPYAFAVAGAWGFSCAAAYAGATPPAADPDNGSDLGILLLVLVGAVVLAAGAKTRPKPSDEGGPAIVDDQSGAGDGKY